MLIGEVCRLAGCTPRTVRHYEEKGIVAAVGATAGGRKLYDSRSVVAIRTARLLQRLGYSLDDICHIIDLTRSGDTRGRRLTGSLRSLLREVISGLDRELELLTESRHGLGALLEETSPCESCGAEDCGTCSRLAALRTLGLVDPPEAEPSGPEPTNVNKRT